jgi:hypothetical protein
MSCGLLNQEYDELDVLHAQGKQILLTYLLVNCMVEWGRGKNTSIIKTYYRGTGCKYVNLIPNGVHGMFYDSIDQCSDYTKAGNPSMG